MDTACPNGVLAIMTWYSNHAPLLFIQDLHSEQVKNAHEIALSSLEHAVEQLKQGLDQRKAQVCSPSRGST